MDSDDEIKSKYCLILQGAIIRVLIPTGGTVYANITIWYFFVFTNVPRIGHRYLIYTLDSAPPLVKLKPRIFQRLPPFE